MLHNVNHIIIMYFIVYHAVTTERIHREAESAAQSKFNTPSSTSRKQLPPLSGTSTQRRTSTSPVRTPKRKSSTTLSSNESLPSLVQAGAAHASGETQAGPWSDTRSVALTLMMNRFSQRRRSLITYTQSKSDRKPRTQSTSDQSIGHHTPKGKTLRSGSEPCASLNQSSSEVPPCLSGGSPTKLASDGNFTFLPRIGSDTRYATSVTSVLDGEGSKLVYTKEETWSIRKQVLLLYVSCMCCCCMHVKLLLILISLFNHMQHA